jgi:hypothetical protein
MLPSSLLTNPHPSYAQFYALYPLLQASPLPPSRVLWVNEGDDEEITHKISSVAAYLDVQAGQSLREQEQTRSGLKDFTNTSASRSPRKNLSRVRHFAVPPDGKITNDATLLAKNATAASYIVSLRSQ